MKNIINTELVSKAFSYEEYKALVKDLLLENKTTGFKYSEKDVYFTRLNEHRIRRIEKTTVINEELKDLMEKISGPLIFLVIAEAWCGDVAQNLPVLKKIAELNKLIEFKIILRDENENVMNEFLTDGGKAIPVCIILDKETMEVIGRWGPRPAPAQAIMIDYKKTKSITHDEVTKNIQLWYANDKMNTIQKEFLTLINKLITDSKIQTSEKSGVM